jgi:hypothetical protein
MIDDITTDAAHGTISAHRTTVRPTNRRLSNWASSKEITTVATTTTTTHATVRNTTCGSAGSRGRSKYFDQPAEPRT